MPMKSVGNVRRSFAFTSCPGYDRRTMEKIGPKPEAKTTAVVP